MAALVPFPKRGCSALIMKILALINTLGKLVDFVLQYFARKRLRKEINAEANIKIFQRLKVGEDAVNRAKSDPVLAGKLRDKYGIK